MSTQLALANTASFTKPVTTRPPKTRSITGSAARRSPNSARNAAQVRKTRANKGSRHQSATGSGVASRPQPNWRIDEGTRQAGRVGIASARQALADARLAAFNEQIIDAA